jgi:4-hydroxythreonine-4-phosphate dehydrogenase
MTTIAVSSGCPSGIGPEISVVAVSALATMHSQHGFVLFGDEGAIEAASAVRRVDLSKLANVRVMPVSKLPEAQRRPGKPSVQAGRSQLDAIDRAIEFVLARNGDAIVTGPVSKAAIASTGVVFTGHTERLAEKTNSGSVVMCFVGPTLRTSLVTTHLPLRSVHEHVTRDRVVKAIVLTARALWKDFGVTAPRVAVCGLNPHAGESGVLGDEEIHTIMPAIDDARAVLDGLATIEGPVPAETAFRYGRGCNRYDAVVAMYHDQATIASKLSDFGDAVNVTLGLPIIRTSVDHGTAYDIAYTGAADARAMTRALELAIAMTEARNRHR